MYKHILVPIALDHNHEHARALKLAERLLSPDGRLTLLHVLEEIPAYVSTQLPVELMVEGEAAVAISMKKIAAELKIPVDAKVIHGPPGATIVDVAEKSDIDCIVMRSHRPDLADYLLGSTAARVVRHAMCSVHVIR
ncbi:MAG: universal stress protein [Paracoccaceae bacterium]